MMKDLKVVFMGTPDFSVPVLNALIENTNVSLVVCQPDKLVGRKQILMPPPIKKVALEHNIKVFQPVKIKEDYEEIINEQPDIIITCAYGQIIPKVLLDLPQYGCINVHASLLPKLRGGAPIHHALIDGYEKTGITIMYMAEGMDDGDIIAQEEYVIKKEDNVGILHDTLAKMGAKLLMETLPMIIQGTNKRVKQNPKEVTFAYNIKREEEHLDFHDSCQNIYNKVRGLNPWPLANIILGEKEVKVLECEYKLQQTHNIAQVCELTKDAIGISAQDGIIYLKTIKPFSKKIMTVKDYLNGIKKDELLNKKVK